VKKVLLISYFFPPCNLTASERVYSWAKHLNASGYYPIVITRRWDHQIKSLEDVSIATPTDIIHQKNDSFEMYQLPYIPNTKDKIYSKYGNKKMVLLRRTLSLIEIVLQRYINSFIPYNNIGQFADELISKNNDIKNVIISGNPYILFKYGYQLQKKYNVKWIADYRDAWTTSEIDLIERGFLFKWIRDNDKHLEKKWVGTASAITSVSEPLLNEISSFVGVKGKWISNGFETGEFDKFLNMPTFNDFTITYVGTLYHGQQIEFFCEAFIKLINNMDGIKVKLLFPGLAFHQEQHQRINNCMQGYEQYFECTERTEKEKILEIEARSHLLLYPAWKGFKGIIASKIYEYISSGTHTLVAPSDNGEVEKIIIESGCGTCTNTVDETYNFLVTAYKKYEQGIKLQADLRGDKALFFSRKHQAKRLAELLDAINK